MSNLSRIDALITGVENGEPVDWAKVSLLAMLDCIRMGESSLNESIEREKEADAKFEQLLDAAR